jgi:hypothetical protein
MECEIVRFSLYSPFLKLLAFCANVRCFPEETLDPKTMLKAKSVDTYDAADNVVPHEVTIGLPVPDRYT